MCLRQPPALRALCRVPFCLHSHQHFLSLVIFIITILTGARLYLVLLICISLMINDVEHLSMYLASVSILCKNIYSDILTILWSDCFVFCGFFFFAIECMDSLCILDINPLSDIWFSNIFSHSLGCHFILLLASFLVQNISTCFFSSSQTHFSEDLILTIWLKLLLSRKSRFACFFICRSVLCQFISQ